MDDLALDSNQAVSILIKKVGIPKDFLDRLADEDDWSLIIKTHALLESTATYAITARLGEPAISEIVANMEMSSLRCGKLGILCNADLLPPPMIKFIQKLSELRNELVHNARNVTFSFCGENEEKVSKKLRALKEAVCKNWQLPDDAEGKRVYSELYDRMPSFVIREWTHWTLANLYLVTDQGLVWTDVVQQLKKLVSETSTDEESNT